MLALNNPEFPKNVKGIYPKNCPGISETIVLPFRFEFKNLTELFISKIYHKWTICDFK